MPGSIRRRLTAAKSIGGKRIALIYKHPADQSHPWRHSGDRVRRERRGIGVRVCAARFASPV
jgi:hypothetical protein